MKHLKPSQTLAISRINHFFDIWSLPAVLKEADIIFRKAASDKAWRPPSPWHAVHYCEQLWQLSKAAYTLNKKSDKALAGIISVSHGDDGPDLSQSCHFQSNTAWASPFSHMPRQLSAVEYSNPLKALAAFCSYRPKKYWKKFFRQLAECALSSSSLQADEPAGRLLRLQQHIVALIEACHLIHVRLACEESKD